MTRSHLLRAAKHLSELASDLRYSYTVAGRFQPKDSDIRREWAELRTLAYSLRKMAGAA